MSTIEPLFYASLGALVGLLSSIVMEKLSNKTSHNFQRHAHEFKKIGLINSECDLLCDYIKQQYELVTILNSYGNLSTLVKLQDNNKRMQRILEKYGVDIREVVDDVTFPPLLKQFYLSHFE